MKITYYSHSTYSISLQNYNIIIDPFFNDNPLYDIYNDLFYKCINSIIFDFIFITHAHYDHVSNVVSIAKRCDSLIISNYEICNYYSKMGLKTMSINYGSFINVKNLFFIKYVWAAHSSSFKDGTYGGNPGGFIFHEKSNNHCIYISGDTALTEEMRLIPIFTKNIDLAILPIGGIFTMNFKEACIASDFINCNKILAVHYDTYPLIKVDHNKVKKYFSEKKKEIIFLNIGNSILL